ncbi:oxidoreductase [Luteipulveratus mongoliensis]|uniref:Oxidoreductase n=2 Tax=Luteipulveratus mongoliensis TaxID=571913 RepID=A0A0K1JQV1_9MICO|nr:oxidoreductase [Luteipulveratus mongoliensis]
MGVVPTAHASATDRPSHHPSYGWTDRSTGADEQYRGLAAVSGRVAWVSGEKGSVLRTTDGGRSWTDVSPAAAKTAGLALRDIEAWDSRHAVALSIGNGSDSRIFRTSDGGKTWTEAFRNAEEPAFYDCMAFSSRKVGLAMSDPVDGHIRMARTTDGGKSWSVLPTAGMPAALDGEFGFAASGTCLVTAQRAGFGSEDYWLVTGGKTPRVFHTTDAGDTWTVMPAPIRGGEAAGIYSVAFRDRHRGVMVGGDYTAPTDGTKAAATSEDGGRWWSPSSTPLSGYRSGVAFDPRSGHNVIAVGPTGSDVSTDLGRSWKALDTKAFDGIHCANDGTCWASGPHGAVAQLTRR